MTGFESQIFLLKEAAKMSKDYFSDLNNRLGRMNLKGEDGDQVDDL